VSEAVEIVRHGRASSERERVPSSYDDVVLRSDVQRNTQAAISSGFASVVPSTLLGSLASDATAPLRSRSPAMTAPAIRKTAA
jgi:hypothetical protein